MEVHILEERTIDIDEIIIISKEEVLEKLLLNSDEIYIVRKKNSIKLIVNVALDSNLTGNGVLNIEGELTDINIKKDIIFSFDLKKFYKIGQ